MTLPSLGIVLLVGVVEFATLSLSGIRVVLPSSTLVLFGSLGIDDEQFPSSVNRKMYQHFI